MAKKTIDLKKDEVCYVVKNCDTVIVFHENKTKKDKLSTGIELILPDEGILDDLKEYSSVNLATAITLKLKTDPNFGHNLVAWLTDYVQNHSTLAN